MPTRLDRLGRCLMPAALLLAPGASALQAQAGALPGITDTTLELEDGSVLRYGISVPAALAPGARPLVVALHPGGRTPYYGSEFMQNIVEPGFRSWDAVIVAPDVPDRSWTTVRSERAVLALVRHVLEQHPIDPDRVLVTGYSMGGRGAWHIAARFPEVFSAAVVVAGSPGDADLERLHGTPLYLIHSPDDQVAAYGPVERAYLTLAERGDPVELRVLPGLGHYMMGAYIPALRLAASWVAERWSAPEP